MLSYIIGKIVSINKKSITVESNWTGYVISVACPEVFELGKVKKIYIHKNVSLTTKNNIQESYYGFSNFEEKEMFLRLISLSGIGPKTAIQILRNDINLLKNMLISKDINGLSSLTSINEKIARQMIENIDISNYKVTNTKISELINALQSLGYEKKEIDYVISRKEINTNQSKELSDLISCAIQIIAGQEETNGITKTK